MVLSIAGLAAGLAAATLRVDTYARCMSSGPPVQTFSVRSGDIHLHAFGCLAEVTGVLHAVPADYMFACEMTGGQNVFVWVDDHLICHSQSMFGQQELSGVDGAVANPIEVRAKQMGGDIVALPFVAHIYAASNNSSGDMTSSYDAWVSVRWARLHEPLDAGTIVPTSPLPDLCLSPLSPALEVQRRELQREAASGWRMWTNNLLSIVRLPHSIALTTSFCAITLGQCLLHTHVEDTSAIVRIGPNAVDGSYAQFYISYCGINISISIVGGNRPLRVLIEPVGCGNAGNLMRPGEMGELVPRNPVNCSDFLMVGSLRYVWQRLGRAFVNEDASFIFQPAGFLHPGILRPTRKPIRSVPVPSPLDSEPHAVWSFAEGAIGLSEVPEGHLGLSLSQVRQEVAAAAAAEAAASATFGDAAEIKEAVQAAVMWNTIYTPAEYGPTLPVSRAWDFIPGKHDSDWAYVLFDWDNFFASYMMSLDPRPAAKSLSYSNLIQVVRSRTSRGFVPNYSAGGSKSVDRSEPPVGARVLLELYRRYGDIWIVRLLYNDLRAWSDWFLRYRADGPFGIISLGSDTISGYQDVSAGTMQGARYESGLDNSPMYDGEFFNKSIRRHGSVSVGLMELSDVGFASLFTQEAEALAQLAAIIGLDDEVAVMLQRADEQRRQIANHLWDEESSAFVNKFHNGSFYRRISPTSFYALGARAASDKQAALLVSSWLLNATRFCIAPDGNMSMNTDVCYWGLPSISASDPAFPPLGYWRGFVWGPMALLVYWSLLEYDHISTIRVARKALCKQMTALMVSQWRRNRHICENFSPHRDATDCTGTKFYHWGALTGLISVLEAGHYSPLSENFAALSAL